MKIKDKNYKKDRIVFANELIKLGDIVGFKVSSRGWAYILEQSGEITKAEMNKATSLINDCREQGLLPVDFIAEEKARMFAGVHTVNENTIENEFSLILKAALKTSEFYNLNWWENETYYIQMLVEKVDLVTLFNPICEKYRIPIANAKGWTDINQRAQFARRFKDAEAKGLQSVLLYCGDHDPDGIRISNFLHSNINKIKDVVWSDGETGYDPQNLIVDRFGLNYDFIIHNNFIWIDNLITGRKKNLASPKHANFKKAYVQKYLKEVGVRKCEANVLVTRPDLAKTLCTDAIEKYLGVHSHKRFEKKLQGMKAGFKEWLSDNGYDDTINNIINESE